MIIASSYKITMLLEYFDVVALLICFDTMLCNKIISIIFESFNSQVKPVVNVNKLCAVYFVLRFIVAKVRCCMFDENFQEPFCDQTYS